MGIVECAQKCDLNFYLKKYYPSGYKLLAKSLKSIEKEEKMYYNNYTHKLVEQGNMVNIVRALDVLCSLDENVANVVDGDSDESFALPSVYGIPLAGYGMFGDFLKKGFNNIKNGLGKALNKVKDRVDNTVQSLRDASNTVKQVKKEYEFGKYQKIDPKTTPIISEIPSNAEVYQEPNKVENAIGKIYDAGKKVVNTVSEDARRSAAYGLDVVSAFTKNNEKVKSFTKNLAEDLRNYDGYNSDVDKVKNSHYISNYKGNLTVKNELSKNTPIWGTFSFGDIIALEKISAQNDDLEDTLKHEYGHSRQFDNIGLLSYIAEVAIPSMTGNVSSRNNGLCQIESNRQYYSQPWENSADELGGLRNRDIGGKDRDKIKNVGEKTNPHSPYAIYMKMKKILDSWN